MDQVVDPDQEDDDLRLPGQLAILDPPEDVPGPVAGDAVALGAERGEVGGEDA